MSSSATNWSLPPLVLYSERPHSSDKWQDRLESAVTAWPMSILPRLAFRRVDQFLDRVNSHETVLQNLDEATIGEIIDGLRVSLRRKGFQDATVARAFALVRETARKKIGLRHHDAQLRGGFFILRGMVAEMETGEGKTLAATLAAATVALAGKPVHVVTVNDYLAKRDAETMEPLYRALGLTVGIIVHGLSPEERRAAYNCDITYASNKEIAFDYLRDRIALGNSTQSLSIKLRRLLGNHQPTRNVVMRGLHFAIVDEADSILIDESRTPLIISRETDAADEQRWAEDALELANELEIDQDYKLLKDERRIELTQKGRDRLKVLGEEKGGIWLSSVRREESARQALTACNIFQLGDHYLVNEEKIQIVDEYTGRIMADRSWGEGMHQLVEAKEGCPVTSRKVPIARMTFQRFFRKYHQLAGMTGTAKEVASEFWSVYRLPVVRIPTNRPLLRQRLPTQIHSATDEKWQAILQRVTELNKQGRPVLIGTRSVATSEIASQFLTEAGLEHRVLNAAQDSEEAEIITEAGQRSRITVATNIAGRGVDICLGRGIDDLGGLHVILSERHDAGRIDRQLEGRCGRQGAQGSTEAILSLEDSLIEAVDNKLLHRLTLIDGRIGYWCGLLWFHWAQRKAEGSHSLARRELLKFDQKYGTLLAFSGGME